VPTTKGMVLRKLEGHHATKIRSMSQMAIGSKNDPTTRPRNSSQHGDGPKGKNCVRTNEKTKK
jgi:hypothetical protein